MAQLMVYTGSAAPDENGSRSGGVPLAPEGFTWPTCATCEGPMQFIAQLERPGGLLSIFMCANDPGLCDEWDASAGGNRAFLFKEQALAPAHETGNTQLGEVSTFRLEDVPAPDYDEARVVWGTRAPEGQRAVLGQLGGEPSWLQGDERPVCENCGRPMTFAAQLEEGRPSTGANYGGGCAYAFTCDDCRTAAFLWQQ